MSCGSESKLLKLKSILRNLALTLVTKEKIRRLLAMLFLIVFVAELGSHAVICANHSSIGEQSISPSERGHDDPCKSLIICSDSKRKDQQVPNFGHDVTPHNGLLDARSGPFSQIGVDKDPLIPFSTAHCLFRPPSLPFHPPEIS
jgi:hypothetical protein